MSLKDWNNNELKTLLSEKWGFSFNLLTESQEEEAAEDETLNEEEEDELEEGAASSGRAVTPDRGGEDRRGDLRGWGAGRRTGPCPKTLVAIRERTPPYGWRWDASTAHGHWQPAVE